MPEVESTYRGKLQRLEALCQQMLAERRLIIASNRGPLEFSIQDDGSLVSRRGGGGVGPPLTPGPRSLPPTPPAAAPSTGPGRPAPPPSTRRAPTPSPPRLRPIGSRPTFSFRTTTF